MLRKIVSQGARYSFGEAAHNLEELAGLTISAQHVMRLTERIGKEWAQRRDQEIESLKQDKLPRAYTQVASTATVMLDGGRLQTRGTPAPPGVTNPQWQEPKYACLQTLSSKPKDSDPQPEPPEKFLDHKRVPKLVRQIQNTHGRATERCATKKPDKIENKKPTRRARPKPRKGKRVNRRILKTVIATTLGVAEFSYQVGAEVHRRGLDLAKVKGCICDGQNSNWTVYKEQLQPKGFIGILDFLHLLTYLHAATQAVGGTEEQRWRRYGEWVTWAWQGQRHKLLLAINGAATELGAPPEEAAETDPRSVVAKTQTYVINNSDKMDYPRYRKLGLPISSAPIESTIKQFNKRVKGTEKFWRTAAAEAVLQVHAAQLSEDGREERFWSMPRLCTHASRYHKLAAA